MTPLVYVMGASGAGKDSVLRGARDALTGDDRIIIAHRYITRPADAGGENHVSLTLAEFTCRRDAGLFAFHWSAHGRHYGIGIEIDAWRRAGFTVIVSGSRAHFATLDPDDDILPVVIAARPDILARRLAERGRETAPEIMARLQREPPVDHPAAVTIDNSGPLTAAVQVFLVAVRGARARPPAPHAAAPGTALPAPAG
jgi:ribose 1,5-bisphosphokinase